jgi:hypothetical protein
LNHPWFGILMVEPGCCDSRGGRCGSFALAVHVAILAPPYDQMVVDGRKRIESRLTSQCRPPFGQISPGDVVYIKRSGGPFVARGEASRVLMADRLTPDEVDQLARRYNKWIGGADDYWQAKRKSTRYATLVWLRDVQPTTLGPRYRVQHMRAWYVLDDEADPMLASDVREVILTPGALRRDYVIVRDIADWLPNRTGLTLLLDEQPVEVRYDSTKQMLRGAAFGRWMRQAGLQPGDRIAFESTGRGRLHARPIRMSS